MIKRIIVFCFSFFIFHSQLLTQPFVRQTEPFPVQANGSAIAQPFAGGVNSPLHQFADIDADGDYDLFVFDVDLIVDFYRNEGTRFAPNFKLRTGLFTVPPVQSWFRLVDFDGDGKLDFCTEDSLFNGIRVYKNTGTVQQPQFTLFIPTLRDESGADVYAGGNSIPAFADIDADADLDLFTANLAGSINFYRNVGSRTQPRYVFASGSWQCILILADQCQAGCTDQPMPARMHGAAAYSFADIDGDNDLDMFISDLFWTGVFFLRNIGTPDSAEMRCVTGNFPPADSISTTGFNQTSFIDIDGDNDLDVFAGVLAGIVQRDGFWFYRNLGSRTSPNLRLQTKNFLSTIDVGMNARPTLADIDADGDPDMFIGNVNGELARFSNTGTTTAPSFTLADSAYLRVPNAFFFSPAFVDIDQDSDRDLFAGFFDGKLKFFRNTGTPQSPLFVAESFVTDTINVGGTAAPAFVDIDNDGDKDLFVGKHNGTISFYRNSGSPTTFTPTLVTNAFLNISIGGDPNLTPTFSDYENDGDFDLFFGTQDEHLHFYENIGTPANAQFVFRTDRFADVAPTQDTAPAFVDTDGDGDQDLLVGVRKGGLYYYRNNRIGTFAPVTLEIPSTTGLEQNYPNPFNPTTKMSFVISHSSLVSLKVFDVLGREVATLVNKELKPGSYEATFDAAGLASGVYYCRLTASRLTTTHTIKLLLTK